MKTFLFSCMIFLCLNAQSQITLDFESPTYTLFPIQLSENETKYFDMYDPGIPTLNQFSIYNLDGTLYKTIALPPLPDPTSGSQLKYITRSVFDNDPSTIEYIVQYWYDSVPNLQYQRTRIVREDGTILMDEMNTSYASVFNTEEGTKLRLAHVYAIGSWDSTRFYSLPGTLPTLLDQEKEFSETSLSVYPNPNNGAFFIKFNSKEGKENVLELYSSRGKLIDTYNSDNDKLHITNYGLNEGLYLLKSQSDNKNRMTKMIIKK